MKPYYEAGGITLYHGDCLEILPEIDHVDHCLTDPPYEAEAHTLGRRLNGARRPDGEGRIVLERPLDFAGITPELRSGVGAEITRLATGWILVFCQVEAAMLWRDALFPARYFRTQIWRKPDGAPQFTGDRPGMGYESIVTCWNSASRSRWNGGGRHGVYEYCTVRDGSGHMTEKPLPLMRELVTLFTDPGDLILDPFAGSGTTGVAAQLEGRRAILIECEEKWCEVAANRLRYGTKGAAAVAAGQGPLWAPGGTA